MLKNWFGTKSNKTETKGNEVINEFGIDLLVQKFAGVNVNVSAATKLDTVFAAVRDKSESIGQLSAIIKRSGKRIYSGREFNIFSRKPNPFQTLQDFLEMGVAALEFRGNFYAYIVRNRYGNVTEIIPFFNQDGVGVHHDANGDIYYTAAFNDGKPSAIILKDDIFHLKLFSMNGYKGMSPISYNARSLGISISQEDYLSELMENGSLPKGVLSTDQMFKDETVIERMRKQWKERYGGTRNAGETPILEQGLKYQNTGLSPADTQLIMQRKYSREQICSIFRVPPHRIGASEKQTYNNVEQNNIAYLRDALVPIIKKFENAITDLMPESMEFKINTTDFVRGDRKTEVESVNSIWKHSLCSRTEAREALGFESVDEEEVWVIESNNLTLGTQDDLKRIQEQRQRALSNEQNKPQATEENDDTE